MDAHRHTTHRHPHPAPGDGLPTRGTDSMPPREVSRRSVLKLMGASAALASGVVGCDRKPERKIVSRVDAPEYMQPGKPLFYSSTWLQGRVPYGIVIKTVDGRPVAVEGNPEHPLNRGSASAAMKASILSLYDPDRLRAPRGPQGVLSWEEADRIVAERLAAARSIVLLTRSTLGPAEQLLLRDFLAAYPAAQHYVHDPLSEGPRGRAWQAAYAGRGALQPRIAAARVILALDADFLGTDGAVLEAAREFAAGRRPESGPDGAMARLWVAESAMTLTGMNADHRLRLRPAAMPALARALLAALEGEPAALGEFAAAQHLDGAALAALASDLAEHRGAALVMAGAHLPEPVHACVALINAALGAEGATLFWNPATATLASTDPAAVEQVLARGVDLLLCMGVNPVYDWPGGGFASLLEKAAFSVGHGLAEDETLAACSLALPSTHDLESWNDAAPRPGLETICQPVIAPLFGARQEAESLLRWTRARAGADAPGAGDRADWHDYLKARWLAGPLAAEPDGEAAWEAALRAGGRFDPEPLPAPGLQQEATRRLAAADLPAAAQLDLVILPHPALDDGRFADNAWLQELPDPVSRVVWDNPLAVSPATARRLGLATGDRVRVQTGGRSAELPLLVQPGTADDVAVVTLGGGRTRGGQVAPGVGTSVYGLVTHAGQALAERCATGVTLAAAGGRAQVVRTQEWFSMEGRPLALDGTLAEYRADPRFVAHRRHVPEPAPIHSEFAFNTGARWAMAIDLNACTGCGACVTACQAENNIPAVGKEECGRGRDMHWMRIDLYLAGDPDTPTVHHQPVLCQHCANAPCEMVCPVLATSHSPEGINEMTYNRCVGTRYCANNCPYKVRRFNFHDYQRRNLHDPVQELALNPQVTVRGVGVMEKCTFCIQRVNEVRFAQKNAGRFKTSDGAIQTACEQACPARAIVFGDLNDPASRVSELHKQGRAYFLLEELNTKPSVAYLARLRNPHPSLAAAGPAAEAEGGHT